ncbi:hypothetical protein OEG84_01915 [Hoeflea sp. G2-23]|uniref:Beta/gamma crystallin 'Greek key' domain-containing protein n=1 Tax=Hoeflea algicola TaxID=2983763 RepID=A0ABT3Z462_9HYPH|nr:hypothetical protein [Hoeflea algicola]MCY0146506.1 hypothetical protein [Hoeflea algicola]
MTCMHMPMRQLIPLTGLLAVFVAMAVTPANAINRIETTQTDCADIRATLIDEGAAILRYTSKKGLPIYDRYVSNSRMCQNYEVGVWVSLPARDTNACRVIACQADPNDNDDMTRFRPLLQITR